MTTRPDSSKSGPLSNEEKKRLEELEAGVKSALDHGYQLGELFNEILEAQLYREDYSTFEDYVVTEWSVYARTAWNHIAAWKAKKALPTLALCYSQHVLLGSLPLDTAEELETVARKIEGESVRRSRAIIKQYRYPRQGTTIAPSAPLQPEDDVEDPATSGTVESQRPDPLSEADRTVGVAVTHEDYELMAEARHRAADRAPMVREVEGAGELFIETLREMTPDGVLSLTPEERDDLDHALEMVADALTEARASLFALTS